MSLLIKNFQSTRNYRTDSKPIHLLWETDGADKVWLDAPLISLSASGMMGFSPKENTTYSLCASKGSKQERRSIRIIVFIPNLNILYFHMDSFFAERGTKVNVYWKVIGSEEVMLSFGEHQSLHYGKHTFWALNDKDFTITAKAGQKKISKTISFRLMSRVKNQNDFAEFPLKEIDYLNKTELMIDGPEYLNEVENLNDSLDLENVVSKISTIESKY